MISPTGKHRGRPAARAAGLLALLFLAAAPGDRPFYRGDPVPAEVERMYARGLAFLLRSQLPEGNWPGQYGDQPAVVGLAVLAMLAQGDDPNTGPCAAAIRQGLEFIFTHTDAATGYIGPSMYNHGFATLALAEAYGAVADPRLGPALQKAVALILQAQTISLQGAWRYRPDSHDADITVSGAQMVALYAARNAGLAVPDQALRQGLDFFARCQDAAGGFGYTAPGRGRATTAIGALVLALARRQATGPYRAAMETLNQFDLDGGGHLYYCLYYASQSCFHDPGERWTKWNAENIRRLAKRQQADGSWSEQDGTALPTACALLSLALNYRYLPIYER